jgi:serine/threonine protein phosphatase 1
LKEPRLGEFESLKNLNALVVLVGSTICMTMINTPPERRASPPRAPEGKRIYVVGDIHGRCDLLARMHALILADARSAPALSLVVVYLGDYVDRGLASYEVLETLIRDPLAGFERVHIKGNHEDMALNFIAGPPHPTWLFNGGEETLFSYGIETSPSYFAGSDLEPVRVQFENALPASHLEFLKSLVLHHTERDYYFVHAGVRPGVPLDLQSPRDLLWIRDPFLCSTEDFGKCVVHGHSISASPEVFVNRIGIDTGAFYSGRLTCLVLEGTEQRFLHT